jgi:hypothetical protein
MSDLALTEIVTAVNTKTNTRDVIVPLYVRLIRYPFADEIVGEVNRAIIARWSVAALVYIKDRAWKALRQQPAQGEEKQ